MKIDRIEIINITLMKNDIVLKASVEKSDLFNKRIYKHMIEGGVDGLTPVVIDRLYIQKMAGDFNFTKNEIGVAQLTGYKFSAECIAYEKENAIAMAFVIDKSVDIVSCSNRKKINDMEIQIDMCELIIPYKSKIQMGIIEE